VLKFYSFFKLTLQKGIFQGSKLFFIFELSSTVMQAAVRAIAALPLA
jgi:hypothetical protein